MASQSVVEVGTRYDNTAGCLSTFFNEPLEKQSLSQINGLGTNCSVTLKIDKKMEAPVYVYYELENFYQNHRRYVKSRSDQQLAGKSSTGDNCEPQLYTEGADPKEINPCGLIAWSFFNDTYSFKVDGAPLVVSEKGIAWESDVESKFGSYEPANFNVDPATRGGGAITGKVQEDEHFVVWMRTAALPNFRKLWGKIDKDLPAGSVLTVDINNRYNTYKFDGTKSIVLSTTSWLGGKNDFLGIAYLVVGALCLAFGAVFAFFTLKAPRKHGDIAELSWNKKSGEGSN